MWWFGRNGASGFSASSTAVEVTHGIDGTGLTAIVTASIWDMRWDFGSVQAVHVRMLGFPLHILPEYFWLWA
ncbi:Short-chain dehydrogenase TIC 32, chloroplastic [Vitis vinifera]|uniref:Short-chain dehydrogenase TIC 32, chloroplastic n=1 Tax=Vitis vinifera TaxID=29760 RepID=A0A438IYY5_VITVI|nr:Short-chain dehydrogenase TIC 32, chloroplastic [Vitis vinifera]